MDRLTSTSVYGATCSSVSTCYVSAKQFATTCYTPATLAGPQNPLAILITYDGGTTWTVTTQIDSVARHTLGGLPGVFAVSCPQVAVCFVAMRAVPAGEIAVFSSNDRGR